MQTIYFPSEDAFREWLARHGDAKSELLVGFYKVGTPKAAITYKQALDAALCYGWIDGVRRSVDDERYTIRFTPRKPKSVWSAVNIKRAHELVAEGMMAPAGLVAFEARDEDRARRYSYERATSELAPAESAEFQKNAAAWEFFQSQPPSYRRAALWWIVSAKQDETRRARLSNLIECSARGTRPRPFLVSARERRN